MAWSIRRGKKSTGGRPTQRECRSPHGIRLSSAKKAIGEWSRKGKHGGAERNPKVTPKNVLGGGLRERVAESGVRPEPTLPVNHEEQRYKDFWSWEMILDGRGPWAQPGEYRRPKEEAEAAGDGSRRYEGTRLARKPEKQPQKIIGGGAYREYGYAR